MIDMLSTSWNILCESAPFILLGFVLAGLLDAVLPTERVVQWLNPARARSVLLATLVGAPLPLCSCGVLPTAVTLRRKGASKGATLSFLISTPETSFTSVLLTYGLLGPAIAIYRPVAACVTAIVAGLAQNLVERQGRPVAEVGDNSPSAADSCCCCGPAEDMKSEAADERSWSRRLVDGQRYAFGQLFASIYGWVLLGVVAAAIIGAWLPEDVLHTILGGPVQAMVVVALVGVPLYVCAEGSTPIAAALIAAGVSPGAAIVFLLVGPATNIGSLGVLRRELGARTVVVYLGAIVVVALFMGLLADWLFAGMLGSLQERAFDAPLVPVAIKVAGGVVFLLLGLFTVVRHAGQALPRLVSAKVP